MKIVTFLALTLCVFAVAAAPRKASAGRSVAKDSAAAGRGVLVDSRDGKNYRTIRIGNQVWMAENLNFATGNSGCYDNDSGNCAKWGRLYDWQAAMNACPGGWHLPSDEEWQVLAKEDVQGDKDINATGFNALPGGSRFSNGGFYYGGSFASFWSSSEEDMRLVWIRNHNADRETLGREYDYKVCWHSVRCLQDGPCAESTPCASAGRSAVKDSAAEGRGVLVDSRDGKSYRTIRIGNQVWMAENLSHATDSSWCYDNDSTNCAKWGRLYGWQAALGACPSGWHLPSDEEWRVLAKDDEAGDGSCGRALKSLSWKGAKAGTDATGFNALPGGFRHYDGGVFKWAGVFARFWGSTEKDAKTAIIRGLETGDGSLFRNFNEKQHGFSVRCLKDVR